MTDVEPVSNEEAEFKELEREYQTQARLNVGSEKSYLTKKSYDEITHTRIALEQELTKVAKAKPKAGEPRFQDQHNSRYLLKKLLVLRTLLTKSFPTLSQRLPNLEQMTGLDPTILWAAENNVARHFKDPAKISQSGGESSEEPPPDPEVLKIIQNEFHTLQKANTEHHEFVKLKQKYERTKELRAQQPKAKGGPPQIGPPAEFTEVEEAEYSHYTEMKENRALLERLGPSRLNGSIYLSQESLDKWKQRIDALKAKLKQITMRVVQNRRQVYENLDNWTELMTKRAEYQFHVYNAAQRYPDYYQYLKFEGFHTLQIDIRPGQAKEWFHQTMRWFQGGETRKDPETGRYIFPPFEAAVIEYNKLTNAMDKEDAEFTRLEKRWAQGRKPAPKQSERIQKKAAAKEAPAEEPKKPARKPPKNEYVPWDQVTQPNERKSTRKSEPVWKVTTMAVDPDYEYHINQWQELSPRSKERRTEVEHARQGTEKAKIQNALLAEELKNSQPTQRQLFSITKPPDRPEPPPAPQIQAPQPQPQPETPPASPLPGQEGDFLSKSDSMITDDEEDANTVYRPPPLRTTTTTTTSTQVPVAAPAPTPTPIIPTAPPLGIPKFMSAFNNLANTLNSAISSVNPFSSPDVVAADAEAEKARRAMGLFAKSGRNHEPLKGTATVQPRGVELPPDAPKLSPQLGIIHNVFAKDVNPNPPPKTHTGLGMTINNGKAPTSISPFIPASAIPPQQVAPVSAPTEPTVVDAANVSGAAMASSIFGRTPISLPNNPLLNIALREQAAGRTFQLGKTPTGADIQKMDEERLSKNPNYKKPPPPLPKAIGPSGFPEGSPGQQFYDLYHSAPASNTEKIWKPVLFDADTGQSVMTFKDIAHSMKLTDPKSGFPPHSPGDQNHHKPLKANTGNLLYRKPWRYDRSGSLRPEYVKTKRTTEEKQQYNQWKQQFPQVYAQRVRSESRYGPQAPLQFAPAAPTTQVQAPPPTAAPVQSVPATQVPPTAAPQRRITPTLVTPPASAKQSIPIAGAPKKKKATGHPKPKAKAAPLQAQPKTVPQQPAPQQRPPPQQQPQQQQPQQQVHAAPSQATRRNINIKAAGPVHAMPQASGPPPSLYRAAPLRGPNPLPKAPPMNHNNNNNLPPRGANPVRLQPVLNPGIPNHKEQMKYMTNDYYLRRKKKQHFGSTLF